MKIVKMGVVLFSIPAKPEVIPVSAYVNRNAGNKFPHSATITNENKSFLKFTFRMAKSPNGSRAMLAMSILSVAT